MGTIGGAKNRRTPSPGRIYAIEAIMLFLSLVGLIFGGMIGWDFVERVQAVDAGTP